MRNSQQVAKSGEEVRSGYGSNPTAALDAALPPKYTDVMNPDPIPTLILCDRSDYKAAILKTYRSGLGVKAGKKRRDQCCSTL